MNNALATFAASVLTICTTDDVVYFGDRKVFICTIAEAMCLAGQWTGTLNAFKSKLVECQRAGLLTLCRADLVSAMEPDLVQFSEIDLGGATFHFVNVKPTK